MSGEVPEGWTTTPICAVASLNPRHSAAVKDSTAVSFVPMAAVGDSRPSLNYLEERQLGDVRQGYSHFADGDVLFAKITPCMENGKGAVAEGLRNGLGCGTTELIVIRPRKGIEPLYLYWFLAQSSVRSSAKQHFTGSAGQARVPLRFIQDLVLPLPPSAEQRRIAARLETLVARLHARRHRLEEASRRLDRLRSSVLAAACCGRLTAEWRDRNGPLQVAIPAPPKIKRLRRRGANLSGSEDLLADELPEIPSSWRYVRHDWLAAPGTAITYGIVLPGPEVPNGVPYVRQQDIQNGVVRVDSLRHTTRAIAARHPRSMLAEGDVLLCIIRNLRVAIVPSALSGANITQGSVRIRADSQYLDSGYLALYLASPGAQGWMRRRYFGMDMPRINVEDARAIPIALPPLGEQREIVRRTNALLGILTHVRGRLDGTIGAVEQLRKCVLSKAFRGELVPTEAALAEREARSYESATALLERLSEEGNAEFPASCSRRPYASSRQGMAATSASRGRRRSKRC